MAWLLRHFQIHSLHVLCSSAPDLVKRSFILKRQKNGKGRQKPCVVLGTVLYLMVFDLCETLPSLNVRQIRNNKHTDTVMLHSLGSACISGVAFQELGYWF